MSEQETHNNTEEVNVQQEAVSEQEQPIHFHGHPPQAMYPPETYPQMYPGAYHVYPYPPPPQMFHPHMPPQPVNNMTMKGKPENEDADQTQEKNQTWAQIARDPSMDTGSAPTGTPEGVTVPESNETSGKKKWSAEVKEAAYRFAIAQDVFLFSMAHGMDPFMDYAHRYASHMLGYMVPPDLLGALHFGTEIPEHIQQSPQLDEVILTASYLRTLCANPFLASINIQLPNLNDRKYLVCCVKDELEIFRSIKSRIWTAQDESEQELVGTNFGIMSGIGSVIILFLIPSLRKLCGALMLIAPEPSQGETSTFGWQGQWLFCRDIPLPYLSKANYLKNPDYVYQTIVDESAKAAAVSPTNASEAAKSSGDAPKTQHEPLNFAPEKYDGPRIYAIDTVHGNAAFDTLTKYYRNGGILLDFEEYIAADNEGRAPDSAKLICGGPRMRTPPPNSRGRGGSTRGSGRFGRGGNNNGSGRGASLTAMSSRGGSGRGRGRGSGRLREDSGKNLRSTTAPKQGSNRKVEGSDGGLVTLKGQHTFAIQHKKGTKTPSGRLSRGESSTAAE